MRTGWPETSRVAMVLSPDLMATVAPIVLPRCRLPSSVASTSMVPFFWSGVNVWVASTAFPSSSSMGLCASVSDSVTVAL